MIWEELDERLIFLDRNENSMEALLETAGDAFVQADAARKGYGRALIRREKAFPTGLDAGIFGIAIPHTKSSWVLRNTVGIFVLRDPVKFIKMGTENEEISVKLAFILAVKQDSDHIKRLKRIMAILQDEKLLQEIAELENKREIIELIQRKEELL